MASSRKNSTEVINDTLQYKKLQNNQTDNKRKLDILLELEANIKTLTDELKLSLDQLKILLTTIKLKQTDISTAAKTNSPVKKLAAELKELESEKIELSKQIQALRLNIIDTQEKVLAIKTPAPKSDLTSALGVIELIIQQDQDKLKNKHTTKKNVIQADEDLPVDGTHPTIKNKRCTIL